MVLNIVVVIYIQKFLFSFRFAETEVHQRMDRSNGGIHHHE